MTSKSIRTGVRAGVSCRALAALLTVFATAPVSAQGEGDGKAQEPPKLTEWPELKTAESRRLTATLKQFRKPKAELHDGARAVLIKLGEGAAPRLMQRVTDRAENINEHLFSVLDEIVDARHSALLARELKKPSVELRRYVVRRLCEFRDRSLLTVLQTAAKKDKEPEIAFYGALGALALGDLTQVESVLEYSKTHWEQVGDLVATSLTPIRSPASGNVVFELIAKRSAADQMAGLRLARYLANENHHMILKGYLDASQHAVKKEAVNALRVIHGEKPLEKLSVFQVINEAKKWKGKL